MKSMLPTNSAADSVKLGGLNAAGRPRLVNSGGGILFLGMIGRRIEPNCQDMDKPHRELDD